MSKRLLLHACCGPCSLEPIRLLQEEGFDITICWANDNIQPVTEHDRRLKTITDYAASLNIPIIRARETRDVWEKTVAPHAFEREVRCRACYTERLRLSCEVARDRGFDYISTTLAVSPYQLFDTCSDVLIKLAKAYGLEPVVRDFRPYYAEATSWSRELGMYRQNYCGCRFSVVEACIERHEARDKAKACRAAKKQAKQQ